MAGTSLTYNTIAFDYIRTHSIDFKPQFDPSGADYLYTEISIAVEAILNTQLLDGEVPADAVVRMRRFLMQPRRTLVFEVSGKTIVSSPVPGTKADDKFGPIPDSFEVLHINGSETFVVQFKIKTWIFECPGGGRNGSGINPLSHRWTETVTIDENFYTTKVRSGVAIFSGATGVGAIDANFRITVVPPIILGFARTKQDIVISPDGLQLQYTVTDTEQYRIAANPATRFEGRWALTSTKGSAAYQECSAKVWGSKKGTSKADLYKIAVQIVLQRLSKGVANPTPGQVLIAYTYTDNLHQNVVEVRMKMLLQKTGNNFYGMQSAFNPAMDVLQGSQENPPGRNQIGLLLRGSAGLKLVAQAFSNPCVMPPVALPNTDPSDSDPAQAPVTPPTIEIKALSGGQIPTALVANINALYTNYYQEISYIKDMHTLLLPVVCDNNAVFATTAQPTMLKVVNWMVEAYKQEPSAPDPAASSNEVLLFQEVTPQAPDLAADSLTPIYRITGRYVFGVKNAANVNVYNGGRYPFILTSANQPNVLFGPGQIN